MNLHIRITSLAFASALAWTASAADAAGSPSQTSSAFHTSPTKPPFAADSAATTFDHFVKVPNRTADGVWRMTTKRKS